MVRAFYVRILTPDRFAPNLWSKDIWVQVRIEGREKEEEERW